MNFFLVPGIFTRPRTLFCPFLAHFSPMSGPAPPAAGAAVFLKQSPGFVCFAPAHTRDGRARAPKTSHRPGALRPRAGAMGGGPLVVAVSGAAELGSRFILDKPP